MKRTITTVAAALLVGTPALAGLESTYQQQQQRQAAMDNCAHWNAAQWMPRFAPIDLTRIRQFPNGDLLAVSVKLEDGNIRCRGTKAGVALGSAAKPQMGYSKTIFRDGSGSESTVKTEGNELVAYTSYCSKWKCPRTYVSRTVFGSRITPEQRKQDDAAIKHCRSEREGSLLPDRHSVHQQVPTRFSA